MKKIYLHAIWFWFVLLFLAILNGIIREATYKPLLEPYIGNWAHQISSITGITLFFIAIYLFLKYTKSDFTKRDLLNIGIMWMAMTIIFEFAFGYYFRLNSDPDVMKYIGREPETDINVIKENIKKIRKYYLDNPGLGV
ncbi:MAG: hypothetical protein MUP82_05620, partial [Candidatus Marinimicrobia bacterium]|nr:hypothetical protein [Candidatus Neomarinimicrobiota bacterium]